MPSNYSWIPSDFASIKSHSLSPKEKRICKIEKLASIKNLLLESCYPLSKGLLQRPNLFQVDVGFRENEGAEGKALATLAAALALALAAV